LTFYLVLKGTTPLNKSRLVWLGWSLKALLWFSNVPHKHLNPWQLWAQSLPRSEVHKVLQWHVIGVVLEEYTLSLEKDGLCFNWAYRNPSPQHWEFGLWEGEFTLAYIQV